MEDVPGQVPKYFEIGLVDSWQAEATLLHLLFAGHGFQMVAFRVDYLITVQ